MRTRLFVVLLAVVVVAAFIGVALADEAASKKEAEHSYVGAKKCKICHKKDGVYPSWEGTVHATVYDKLTDEQKADTALMKYYTTGTTEKGELLTNVECEACHGPGSDYKAKKIMEDKEAAIANGLVMPTVETCMKCHNADAPGALGESAKDFDFEKMKAKGVHAMIGE